MNMVSEDSYQDDSELFSSVSSCKVHTVSDGVLYFVCRCGLQRRSTMNQVRPSSTENASEFPKTTTLIRGMQLVILYSVFVFLYFC